MSGVWTSGRINGRPFINNVSLGVYAQMVGDPGYRQDKLRVAKSKLQAALSDRSLVERCVSRHPKERRSRASSPLSSRTTPTSSHVGIGQANATAWIQDVQVSVADASTLDSSSSGCFRAQRTHRDPSCFTPLDVRAPADGRPWRRGAAGVDGEPITLEAPLRFSVEPGALRVLVPEGRPEDRRVPPPEAALRAARTLRQWLRPTIAEQESGSGDPHR